MDEIGARIAYPSGEEIIVLIKCKEQYTLSFRNRQSLIVIETVHADGLETLLPFFICLRKPVKEDYIHDNLDGNKVITNSLTRYIVRCSRLFMTRARTKLDLKAYS
jgi:hypothetical protein